MKDGAKFLRDEIKDEAHPSEEKGCKTFREMNSSFSFFAIAHRKNNFEVNTVNRLNIFESVFLYLPNTFRVTACYRLVGQQS